MAKISKSPDRYTFQSQNYKQKLVDPDPEKREAAQAMLEYYAQWKADADVRELDHEWQQNNMEYDLRTTEWILEKVRASDQYAQNLYAAICNNDFVKNDVFPILKDQRWSASWRYAGGIIADMRQEGDYIDWYCSGIVGEVGDEEFQHMSKEAQESYLYAKNNFVSESVVTDEIREDLFRLGWIVVDQEE